MLCCARCCRGNLRAVPLAHALAALEAVLLFLGGGQVSCPAPGMFSHLFINSFSRCEGFFLKNSSGSGNTGRVHVHVCARRADAKTTAKRRMVTRHIVTLQLRRLSDGQRGGCCRHAMAARALVSSSWVEHHCVCGVVHGVVDKRQCDAVVSHCRRTD